MLIYSLLLLLTGPAQTPYADAAPGKSPAIAEEKIYRDFQRRLLSQHPPRMKKTPSARLARISLDAIEDLLITGTPLPLDELIPRAVAANFPGRELARWYRLRSMQKKPQPAEERLLVEQLSSISSDSGLLFELLRQQPTFQTEEMKALIERLGEARPNDLALYRRAHSRAFTPPTAAEVKALFSFSAGKPALYMFCRHNRNNKCLLALRDKNGNSVRDGAGQLWSQPSLGLSAYGYSFGERNGYTPSGVHLINGVMPETNLPLYYGKNRRLILEFVPKSAGEADQKKLLPSEAHASNWWKEAVVARDIGRAELRIHGTGERSENPAKSYYPFVPTVGCVAQREGKYGDVTYNDQRIVLDQLMRASGLSPVFANEPLVDALLYVIELDDRSGAVGLPDLARFGVL